MRSIRNTSGAIYTNHITKYPTPINLSYAWSYGSLSLFFFLIQIITGVLLASIYQVGVGTAFDSLWDLLHNYSSGWFFRYAHSTGATFVFFFMYLHIDRGLLHGSYLSPRGFLWVSGVLLFVLMMATAFLGYVLPWGQMSFWAATVITNLFSAIPLVGDILTQWLWGGFSVDEPTLKRFFTLHYTLPYITLGVIFLHLFLLHDVGSSNPLGIEIADYIPFYPYYFLKDLTAIFFVLAVYFFFMGTDPAIFLHPDNSIKANPMVTPAHIVPEWYFLPFYAMLRSIPNKLGGVLTMFSAILILFFLPLLSLFFTRSNFEIRPFYNFFYCLFELNFFLLGYLGACSAEYPYVFLSKVCTFYYFFFLCVVIIMFGFSKTFFVQHTIYKRLGNLVYYAV